MPFSDPHRVRETSESWDTGRGTFQVPAAGLARHEKDPEEAEILDAIRKKRFS